MELWAPTTESCTLHLAAINVIFLLVVGAKHSRYVWNQIFSMQYLVIRFTYYVCMLNSFDFIL